MKTNAERQAAHRERMRSQGYVIKQIYVKPKHWPRIARYLEKLK